MDKERNLSYEETHKKLVEAMQEACISDEFDDYGTPNIDLSFMNEEPASEKPKKRFPAMGRFYKVATILIILLLGGNIVMMATDSGDSYGEKGLLHRLTTTGNGVLTDNDNPIEINEVITEYRISSIDDIDKIIAKFPELYIIGYMPEEFRLDSLSVKKYSSNDIRAEYIYYNTSHNVKIGMYYNDDSMKKVYSGNEARTISLNDRIISIYEDIDSNYYVADVYFEDCIVTIHGINDKALLEKIACNINKQNAH